MLSDRYDDRPLTCKDVQALSSADALAEFFARLRYPADTRIPMTAEALSLNTTLTNAARHIERLTSVEGGALEVYLFELTSVTVAHTRALARVFRDRAGNFLLVLTDDYRRIDFVLIEREIPGLTKGGPTRRGIIARPRILSVDRRDPNRVALRVLRRFTFTEYDADGRPDPYAQYDKLGSAYTIAEWSEPLFNNRALFSDYYLNQRLPELPEWNAEARNRAFRRIRGMFAQARRRFAGKDAATARQELIQPLLEALGFRVTLPSPQPSPQGEGEIAGRGEGIGPTPDFYLHADGTEEGPSAFVLAYPWNRYLDGKDDTRDDERPEENPGAQVVSLLEAGEAPWGIVTNGKLWRLYSARAHSRATNYYEVNLEETLASPDPGEPFRYSYLLFRADAFVPQERPVAGEVRKLTFLDWLMEESDTYARELGERLKERVFERIFPHLAEGFIAGMGGPKALLALTPEERQEQLQLVFQGTLTFLYRLLFLLYAESRDLLPVREVRGYYQVSLQRLKEEIAEKAGPLEDQVAKRLGQAYAEDQTGLYERLLDLFTVIDRGSANRNVPAYNGGLFITKPAEEATDREAQASRFLQATPIPDRYLALGLDRLARDVDPKRGDLGFIDYKSLGVRQLGSIYEGLLEFKLQVAPEKMAVVEGKKTEEILPYNQAKREKRKILTQGRGQNAAERTLPKGTVYLENDRRERKATGSYYTPDYIVKYIVRHTVGPVMDEKLDVLRPRLAETERRFHKALQHKQEVEGVTPDAPALLGDMAGDLLRDLFDVKVLDPAMGSGHFLVEAVDYVTDRLVRFLDGYPFLGVFFAGMRRGILEEMERQSVTVDPAQLTDVTLLKRHVLKRCIYGVDLNPMAVELAKVSLWLDCFTLGAPLSFLDHHLRPGNSLIGAMARDVEAEMSGPTPGGQMTFLTGPFVGLLRAAEIMRGISAIADVTMEQVRESGNLYQSFDRAAKPYKQLLDVYVAQHFGVKHAADFLTLYGPEAMEATPDELGEPYRGVMRQARALYEEKCFFHWDLEFPEVFIDLERATWKADGGFDAVVGNPPYGDILEKETKRFLEARGFPKTGGRAEVCTDFIVVAMLVLKSGNHLSFIIPNTLLDGAQFTNLRQAISKEAKLTSARDFRNLAIFGDASVQVMVIIFEKNNALPSSYLADYEFWDPNNQQFQDAKLEVHIDSDAPWRMQTLVTQKVNDPRIYLHLEPDIGTCHDAGVDYKWKGVGWQNRGERAKISDLLFYEGKKRHPDDYPLVKGADIDRYSLTFSKNWLVYDFEKFKTDESVVQVYLDLALVPVKILTRQTSDRIQACIDDQKRVTAKSIHTTIVRTANCSPHYVVAVLNSKLLTYVYQIRTGELGRLFAQVKLYDLRDLPIRCIHFITPQAERERLVANLVTHYERDEHQAMLAQVEALLPKDDEGQFLAFQPGAIGAEEKSDVVHDLLGYLAQQMIDMHQDKQVRVAAFWDDLEAVVAPDVFDTLHNKGKWEQSLAKDPACRPYVDAESRSTRSLDESLGWDEDCFAAFAGMLVGRSKVTPPLLDVYRKHHPPYRALVDRIAATDQLIDQVVYRLYGLTEEEVAVVEGKE